MGTVERASATVPRARVSGRAALVDIFEVDPDLAEAANHDGQGADSLVAAAVDVPPGPWAAPQRAEAGALGLLVLHGVLIRRVQFSAATGAELLGPGDLLRPWLEDAESLIEAEPVWEVLEPARLALLNGRAAQLCASRPPLVGKLLDRALVRSRRRTMLSAIAATKRIDERLLLLFGHLAARWGHVTRDGVVVPLPLTHALLADLIAARRPTVTTAIRSLREAGAVERHDEGWLLTVAGQEQLAATGRSVSPA
jgi:CRP/FNR family transcriptional regulator, cyclic AMP receptor protein